MNDRLIELEVQNFRSLRKITVPLGPLNVLVGPNGAGKSNVLEDFRFLADVIRTDLEPALELRGGDELAFWGGPKEPASFRIKLRATWTEHSSPRAPDEYTLRVERRAQAARAPSPPSRRPRSRDRRQQRRPSARGGSWSSAAWVGRGSQVRPATASPGRTRWQSGRSRGRSGGE
ncbi:hypothetical protein E1264_15535 [Actinomadura sp. KC216]|uniref:AAA family ATPase n=1 Tax=Actinomadura sp. KC216 TaxID=2530370 RepID=UPI00104C06AE|nr:AAA family ATPase [Actinomadura sp. KC216]TDB87115.1 hypothetical protein E1264_15535 [Actinomadura sp. KC216]